MLTTMLEEVVNGWVITIYKNGTRQQFIYETLHDAQEHLGSVESQYEGENHVTPL